MFDTEIPQRNIDINNTRVDVYRNLQNECLSIKSRETSDSAYGSVIAHTDVVLLSNVEFVIQEAGQQRARETGRKNVHAMVRGIVESVATNADIEWNRIVCVLQNDVCIVRYNPFETDGFEVADDSQITDHDVNIGDTLQEAAYAFITTNGVTVMLSDGK
jgi:hypothetical protein